MRTFNGLISYSDYVTLCRIQIYGGFQIYGRFLIFDKCDSYKRQTNQIYGRFLCSQSMANL